MEGSGSERCRTAGRIAPPAPRGEARSAPDPAPVALLAVAVVDEPVRRLRDRDARARRLVAELFLRLARVGRTVRRRVQRRLDVDDRHLVGDIIRDQWRCGRAPRSGARSTRAAPGCRWLLSSAQISRIVMFSPPRSSCADAAALERERVPRGDVVDVDDVQHRVRVRDHPPVQEVQDQRAGRHRAAVAPAVAVVGCATTAGRPWAARRIAPISAVTFETL